MRILSTALVLTTFAVAQGPTWNLPTDHSLRYERTRTITTRSLDPAPKPGDPKPPPFGIPGEFGRGVLLPTDLDAKRRSVEREPFDLSELPWVIAFDLSSFRAGRSTREFASVRPFGRLAVAIEGLAPSATNRQRLTCRIVQRPVDAAKMEGPARDRNARLERFRNVHSHEFDGNLTIERVFDAERGLVTEFAARLDAEIAPREHPNYKRIAVTIEESWTLSEEFIADSPAFNERVGAAILAGRQRIAKILAEKLTKIGERPTDEQLHVDREIGEIALMTLTLVKCRHPRTDPLLRDALRALRDGRLRDTYSLAVGLMAAESFYAEPNERDHLLQGLIDRPQPRKPSDEDLSAMKTWVQRLLDNRDADSDRSKVARWAYKPSPGWDNSTTQFAILGLWSAQLCGIAIDKDIWLTAAQHWFETRCLSKERTTLAPVSYRQLERGNAKGTSTPVITRGWSYHGPGGEPYGSMTAAGVASLTLITAALRELGLERTPVIGECRSAIREGQAWLAAHFDVRSNPGRPFDYDFWRSYWLYGLERACELGQVARLGERDWYFEGASLLLAMHEANGDFEPGDEVDDCFALLFLEKAAVPVSTGR